MSKRIDALREIINENKLDGLIITKQQNWQYLSGFSGTNAVLLITGEDNYLITDFRYLAQAAEEVTGFHIVKPFAVIEDTLVEKVTELGLKRLGFEDDSISYHVYSSYRGKLTDVELVPLHQAVETVRQVKDTAEISALRKAAEIADAAFDDVLKLIKPGVRESEIALEIECFMRRKGAQKPAFDLIVASGPRAALPHGVATDKTFAAGELVIIDFGAVYAGYHSDMTRTVVLGQPDRRQRDIYELVLRAQERAIEAIKPGVKCSAVDLKARDMITVEGYGANFGHGLGHGVGLEIHEKPGFTPKDDTVLEPGMVLTVEPGIYLNSWGGVRIEDLVLVTADGYEILSKSPKQLIRL